MPNTDAVGEGAGHVDRRLVSTESCKQRLCSAQAPAGGKAAPKLFLWPGGAQLGALRSPWDERGPAAGQGLELTGQGVSGHMHFRLGGPPRASACPRASGQLSPAVVVTPSSQMSGRLDGSLFPGILADGDG